MRDFQLSMSEKFTLKAFLNHADLKQNNTVYGVYTVPNAEQMKSMFLCARALTAL